MIYLLLLILTSLVHSGTRVFKGVAKYQGQVVYHETSTINFEGSRPLSSSVVYSGPDGTVLGKLDSDFSQNLSAPIYLLQDLRSSIHQGLRYEAGRMVAFRIDPKGEEKQKSFELTANDHTVVAGDGLRHFISHYLEELMNRKEMNVRLIIPGRLDVFDFLLKVAASNKEVVEIELVIKNLLLRFFSTPQRFVFDLETKRLRQFEGVSNLRNSEGEMMSVDVTYEEVN